MNKILELFDEQFVLDFLRREALSFYPEWSEITAAKIRPYKKMIWTTTYHVVLEFQTTFKAADGRTAVIPVICSAHSDEPRELVLNSLRYLEAHNFNTTNLTVPRPLFYSPHFRAAFYQGLQGENLFYYIKNNDFNEVEKMVRLAAQLFARLHAVPLEAGESFNVLNSRIKTVVPGVEFIYREMAGRYDKRYDADLQKIYNYFITTEEKFLATSGGKTLIHGDAHPENIIKTGEGQIGLIDFTDLCIGDPARDIGTFWQQLEYKVGVKANNYQEAVRLAEIFKEGYASVSQRPITPDFQERIDLYYNWTMLRTAIFLFLKHDCQPARGEELLNTIKLRLGF